MIKRLTFVLALMATTVAMAIVADPASASLCNIPPSPGATIYAVNAGANDQACFKVFKDYVSPADFWENWYLQETVDVGTDQGCVQLHLRIVGWTSWRYVGQDCNSADWVYSSGFGYWAPIPDGIYAKIDAKVVFKTGSTTTATRTYYDVANIDF